MKKETKNKAPSKGEYGYIDKKKKNQLLISALSMLMVAIICLTGVILYHTQKSVFAVMAALAALPAAKMLVGYLVIMPYHSVKENVKLSLEEVSGDKENCKIVYDTVLSSSEKSMSAGVVFIKNGRIYGYTDHYNDNKKNTGKNKITMSDIEKHIKFIVDANCNYSAIKMYEDEQKFLKAVSAESKSEEGMSDDELLKMRNMNEKIEKQLKIYMF